MNVTILDSIFELGLRAMLILLHQAPRPMSLERIIYFDYYSSYNIDLLSNTDGVVVLPPYPYRTAELYNKHQKMQEALRFYASKNLISINCDDTGISYTANPNTHWMFQTLKQTSFAQKYSVALSKCASALQHMSEEEIRLHGFNLIRTPHDQPYLYYEEEEE